MNQIDPWSDERLKPGDDWKREIENALARANTAILLVSADFLASDFITRVELPSLLMAAEKRRCKVVPVIIGPCAFLRIQSLQRFQAVNPPDQPLRGMRPNKAEETLAKLVAAVADQVIEQEGGTTAQGQTPKNEGVQTPQTFFSDPRVDRLIAGVTLGDWAAAEQAALGVIVETDRSGCNGIFESLLNYQDCSDEDERFWGALHTIECCVRLAPWLITHAQMSRMAEHENFSVRSSAASICMDLAHSAPDRVPLDLVMRLSVYNEDWYVQAPANAALKAMARTTPEVLRIFRERTRSSNIEESAHSASAISDIADTEPGLLDPKLLKQDLSFLKERRNADASRLIGRAISKAAKAKRIQRYRYGL